MAECKDPELTVSHTHTHTKSQLTTEQLLMKKLRPIEKDLLQQKI